MRFFAKWITLGVILPTSGCATHWSKPSGASPLWDLDDCEYRAAQAYPIRNEVVYDSSTHYDYIKCENQKTRECRKDKYERRQYMEVNHSIEDVNARTRDTWIDACMVSKGWSQHYHWLWDTTHK